MHKRLISIFLAIILILGNIPLDLVAQEPTASEQAEQPYYFIESETAPDGNILWSSDNIYYMQGEVPETGEEDKEIFLSEEIPEEDLESVSKGNPFSVLEEEIPEADIVVIGHGMKDREDNIMVLEGECTEENDPEVLPVKAFEKNIGYLSGMIASLEVAKKAKSKIVILPRYMESPIFLKQLRTLSQDGVIFLCPFSEEHPMENVMTYGNEKANIVDGDPIAIAKYMLENEEEFFKDSSEEEPTEEIQEEPEVQEEKEEPAEEIKKKDLKKAPLKAPAKNASDSGYTITFDANGGFFNDPGVETNDITYEWGPLPNEKYSHTFNISDDGTQNGNYNHNMNTPGEVISFPGASSLKAVITYGGESVSWDWACMWKGSHPNYSAASNYSSSVTGKLGGGNHTAASNTKTYTVQGDSVTFSFKSDGSGYGDGYGYYAVVTPYDENGDPILLGDGNNIVSGTYIDPRQPGKVLEGWYSDPECTQPFDVTYTQLSEDTTVYAKYQDDDWYKEYTYTLNPDTHEIVVTKYNGNAVNIVLPSKAIINGVEYSTVVNGPVYQGKTANSITFDEGIKSGTNLKNCFSGCPNLTNLKLRDFDTSAATNMGDMFDGCTKLTTLDVTGFNTGNVTDMSNMFTNCSSLTSLDVSGFDTGNVTNMGGMFSGCSKLTSLDLSHFDTADVTSMASMFRDCSALTSLDVSHFDTGKCKNMAFMFYNCYRLPSLDVSSFNTENVENMSSMFNNCYGMTSLDVSNFNTGKVKNFNKTFYNCYRLKNLDVSGFNTESATNMSSMFTSCSGLTSLDVSGFNTGSATDMSSMFSGCSGLTSLDVDNFNTQNVQNMAGMFSGCSKLTKLDLSDWNTGNVTNMSSMFSGCTGMKNLDISNFNTEKVTTMASMFYNCYGLTNLDVNSFDTKNVTDMSSMFYGCSGLTALDISRFNTGKVKTFNQMFAYASKLTSLDLSDWNTGAATNMASMFRGCSSLVELDVRGLETQNVTTMEYMFAGCQKLPTLDLSSFNTGKVTNMRYMFNECYALKPIDVSSFNTSNVTNMTYMFANCRAINELDLSNFNTGKVTNMSCMFYGDTLLEDLDVSSFNTANVTNMQSMFSNCKALPELDITNFNTGKVTNMSSMFSGCSGLPEIDLTHFNTANVTTMSSMFNGCSNMTEYDLSSFNTGKVTNMNAMFAGNTSLTNLDLSNFNTANVTDMGSMFYGNTNLENLDVSSFNTGKVTQFYQMFYNCKKLEELDVSNFNTANATQMYNMFQNCENLKELDVTGFNTKKVQSTYNMFAGCNSLDEIDVSSFDLSAITSSNTSNMFNSTSLKKITLGPNFKFKATNTFPSGNWFKGDTDTKYSAQQLYQQYNASMADTYNKELVVTFNPVGGAVDTKKHYVIYDKEIETLPNATKLGYQFEGWYTEKSRDDGEQIHVGDHYQQDTYYAHWSPNHYTLRLNPNGGNGETQSILLAYDDTIQLNGDIFERPRYELYEWNTKQDGSGKSYAPDDEITMMTAGDGDTVILYAQWSNDWVDITFDSDGGAEVPGKHILRGKKVGALYEPAKEGYSFMGWYTEPNGQGSKITSDTVPTKDVTYYAFWEQYPVVTFDDGTSTKEKIIPYGNAVNTLPEPKKENYIFDDWYTEPNGQGEKVTKNRIITEDVTFYANWLLQPIFDQNGGIITVPEDTSNYDEKDPEHFVIDSLPTASKPGYDFLGWFTKDGTEVHVGDEINLYDGSTIHAEWESHEKIKITFDGNGATSPSPIQLYKDQAIGALPNLSRQNKKFLGWFTEDDQPVDPTTSFSEDTTIHAKWESLVAVMFDSNGGSSVSDRKVTYGSTINTIPGSRRSGYVLEGWYDKNGNRLTTDTVFTKQTTYTANWVPERHNEVTDTIDYIYGASWSNASNANVDNVNNNLEFHPTDSETQTAQLHLRFELNQSVDNVLPVGSINIRIPKQIFENWNGDKTGSTNISDNLPKYPEAGGNMVFSYIEEEDCYVLVNNRDIPGGAGVDITIDYYVNPTQVPGGAMDYDNEYIDGYPYYQNTFPVTFTIDQNMDGTIDVEQEQDLSLEMHTRVRTTQSKSCSSVYYKWNTSWGPKPSDADNCFYIVWNLNENTNTQTTNQPYTYHWSEDTVHDGTVVRLTNGSVITKHPNSLLQNLDENGLTIYNEAIVTEDWKSGYETSHRVHAQTVIRDRHYPTGEFSKWATSSHMINGGQEVIVDDEGEISMPYELLYNGSSYNIDTMPVPDGEGYTKKPRTITFEDGVRGDILYNSGSPNNKYVWEPDTGNIVLGDSDYYFRDIRINLQEYDSTYRNGAWTTPFAATDTTQYDNVEIWIRLANQDEFIKYKTILGTNNSTIQLPERTVGFKVVHSSEYYSTRLQANATLVLKPTQKVMSLIQNDLSEKTTSIIKNIARCDITDTQGESFFHVTNDTGGQNSAYKELYELNISNTYMYVKKNSAVNMVNGKNNAVIMNPGGGTQDNPMVIWAWNYNNANHKKLLNNTVFYDLLPFGTTVDPNTIYGVYYTGNSSSVSYSATNYNKNNATVNRNYYNVEFIENWDNSGQTMMVITTNLPKSVKNTGIAFYYLLRNTYQNILDYGTVLENDVACANIAQGHVPPVSVSGPRSDLHEKDHYFALERQYEGDIGFAMDSTHYNHVSSFSWAFTKTVQTDGDFKPEGETFRNKNYRYRLTYEQSDDAHCDSFVFYDVIEGGTEKHSSQWYGLFESVDVESAKKVKGYGTNEYCNPVVYYSTKPRDAFEGSDYDVSNTEVWTTEMPADKTTITAIAVDCRKTTGGKNFILKGRQMFSVYINMKAPSDPEKIGLTTVNGAVSYARKYNGNVPEDEPSQMRSDCSVKIKDSSTEIHKTSTPPGGTIEKPTLVDLGEVVNYKISVTNKDTKSVIYNVVVEDPIPDNMIVNNSEVMVYSDSPNHSVPVTESTRVSFTRMGQNLRFVIKEMLPNETVNFIIPAISDGNHIVYANQAGIIQVDEFEKEIVSEITYHETNFWPIHFSKKITGTDDMLSGAVLSLTDSNNEIVRTWTSGEEAEIVNLIPGDYTLTEMNEPEGFMKSKPITFSIAHDGKVTANPTSALSGTDAINMYDTPRKNISLDKEISGNNADPNDVFVYEVTLHGLEAGRAYSVSGGTAFNNGVVPASFIPDKGTDEYFKTFKVSLKAGQTFTVNGLPNGATYQIKEEKNSYTASYSIEAEPGSVIAKTEDANTLSGHELATATETIDLADSDITVHFSNVRNHKHGSTTLQAKKLLDGETLQNEQFEFTLYDPKGNPVETVRNDAEGNINFSVLNFKAENVGKDHIYRIRETKGNREDIQYDDKDKYVKINVEDTETDELDVKVSYYDTDPTKTEESGSETLTIHNYKKQEVTCKKRDEEGQPLNGAILQILDSEGNVVDEWTDSDHVTSLITGSYVFHEARAPIGYNKAADIPIVVTADGTVTINGEETNEVTMTDPVKHGSIKIHKVDETEQNMPGAVFRLIDKNGETVAEKTTDAQGKTVFDDVPAGQYQIVEARTADGHTLLRNPINVTLPLKVAKDKVGDADISQAEEYEGFYYFFDLGYKIKNDALFNVPYTGAEERPYILLGIALLLVLVWFLRKPKKKEISDK